MNDEYDDEFLDEIIHENRYDIEAYEIEQAEIARKNERLEMIQIERNKENEIEMKGYHHITALWHKYQKECELNKGWIIFQNREYGEIPITLDRGNFTFYNYAQLDGDQNSLEFMTKYMTGENDARLCANIFLLNSICYEAMG